MRTHVEVEEGIGRVALSGHFTFAALKVFREATDPLLADPAVTALHLDLGGVGHMEASSLGMLLVLREKAAASGKGLEISALSPSAALLLESVHFEHLFRIVK